MLGTVAFALLLAAPTLADPAGDSQGAVSNPASPAARQISDLFWTITYIAFAVGIFVEALLVYTLLKFRAREPQAGALAEPAKGEHEAGSEVYPAHHGNTRLEAGYTAVTAVVFALLVVVSWGTLFAIETPPEGDSMTVEVIAHQWSWEFRYPAEGITEFQALSEMHVPVNMIVKLEVTSADVAHAIWIPDLGVKLDAYPGRVNRIWFQAEREGRFLLQCAEFCGEAHSSMHAVVVAESQGAFDAWVAAKRAAANPPPPPLTNGSTVNVALSEYAITTALPLNVEVGANIIFHIVNNGTAQHAFALGEPYNLSTPLLNASESMDWTVAFTEPVANGSFFCPVSGHRGLGMEGSFNVTEVGRIIDIYLHDAGVPGDIYRIEPATVELAAGEVVRFRVHNVGAMSHNLRLDAPYPINTPWFGPGESLLTAPITAGESAAYWCDVPGHQGLGMVGSLVIEGSGPTESPTENVPGFDLTSIMPAVSFAAVALLWARGRRRTN